MAKEEQAANTTEQAVEPAKVEYVEYVGYPPLGAEFDDARIITRKEAKDAWDISIPKDLIWVKSGAKRRMLLPVSEIPAEVMDLLLEDTAFRRVEV